KREALLFPRSRRRCRRCTRRQQKPARQEPMRAPRAALSRSRRLDRSQELFELLRGVADAVSKRVNDIERALVLADLQQFVDEIFVGLQLAQQLREFPARSLKFPDRRFGCGPKLAPAVDQELAVFRLEAVSCST